MGPGCSRSWVVLDSFAGRVTVDADEAAVEAANRPALVAQQLLEEALVDDAQVGADDVIRRKAGVAARRAHDRLALAACSFASRSAGCIAEREASTSRSVPAVGLQFGRERCEYQAAAA